MATTSTAPASVAAVLRGEARGHRRHDDPVGHLDPAQRDVERKKQLVDKKFISPAELFRRRRDGRFGHAIVALVLVTAVIFFATRDAMEPIFEAEFQRGLAAQPGITPEQMETARNFGRALAPVMVRVGLPIACLLLGLVVWAVARFFGTGMGYQRGAAIASFAMFPRLLEGVTNAAQALLMDQGKLTSLVLPGLEFDLSEIQ